MFSKFLYCFLLLVFMLALHHELPSQSEVNKQRGQLRKIQKEILAVQKEIAGKQKEESSQLFLLNSLDLDIDLTQTMIQELRQEMRTKETQIAKIEASLKQTQEEVQRLKEILSKRLVYFYKHGRIKDLELLLTARSLNQGLLWLEYQKRLANQDHRNFKAIIAKEKQIQEDRQLKRIELEKHKTLLAEKVQKERLLTKKKQSRQQILNTIRNDIKLRRKQLAAKQQAVEELKRLIAELQSAPTDVPLLRPDMPIAELRGRMLWPAQGEIIRKFGKQRHPELRTVTENLGIDIRAPLGSDVLAVASGIVTQIRWMRGHGTVVMVRHYGGYLTVYSHFQEIMVAEGEEVEMGQIIGTVGESASLDGPVLHFEIWKGTQKLNPESWLGRAT